MFKYVVTFSKTGTICYTSHLDLMRLFKRIFKRAGISLAYSKGFNPHPKMGFAQPLSLGYIGLKELFEFETTEEYDADDVMKRLKEIMPAGLDIMSCERIEENKKTLAAMTFAADYHIFIPIEGKLGFTGEEIKEKYMGQTAIITLKKQKKKKEPVEIDIKPKIRNINIHVEDSGIYVETRLDSGSESNLSPELVITTLVSCLDIDVDRNEVEVTRENIYFD